MKLYSVLFCASLFLCANAWGASPAEKVEKALEQAAVKACAAAQTEENQPAALTENQQKEIPSLLDGVVQRLHEAGYTSMTQADAVEGIKMYFEVTNALNGLYTSEDMKRLYDTEVSATKGDEHQHALMYALVKLMPQNARRFPYDPADYPQVKNWKEFNALCQLYMENVYKTLTQLQSCDWDTFKSIMCNVM